MITILSLQQQWLPFTSFLLRNMARFVFNFFLSAIVMSILTVAQELPTFASYSCTGDESIFIQFDDDFKSNLKNTLSSLEAKATFGNKFYNTSSNVSPDRTIYSLFLCKGDISPEFCRHCVHIAQNEIVKRCPNRLEAIIWYDECTLRFSDRYIFSQMEEAPKEMLSKSESIVTDQDRDPFTKSLGELMNRVVTQALSSDKYFAVGNLNDSVLKINKIYGLAQCTPDIPKIDCKICLTGCVRDILACCNGTEGGRVFKPSCNIRFETFMFYESSAPPMAPLLLPSSPPKSMDHKREWEGSALIVITIAIIVPTAGFALILMSLWYLGRRREAQVNHSTSMKIHAATAREITTEQSLQYDWFTIKAATNNFSSDNKIGAGGFGSVYKGILPNGDHVAVKRLSPGSGQGEEEFKNEAMLVANLQHKNLVRLIGFCIHGIEKILVYEFVHNKSLDNFLFDIANGRKLDWTKRYKIIEGISRGLHYLHEDSRLRIIHRDLKSSNVLLDGEMNPKISDFGMARSFKVNQLEGITSRVVGTYGYMSPEYAMLGQYSVKSDVFSFGILTLEIVSGKRNASFNYSGCQDHHLVNFAWRHWREGKPLEILDPILRESCSNKEVNRCIHIGLLCVHEKPEQRPTMGEVVLMLNNSPSALTQPQEPTFFGYARTCSSSPTRIFVSDQYYDKSLSWTSATDSEGVIGIEK